MNKRPIRITFYEAVTFLPLILFLAILLAGCGVKERPEQTPQVVAGLPAGIAIAQKQNFLVAGNVPGVQANEDNTIRFRIVDTQLNLLDDSYTFETAYSMPKMTMFIDPAKTHVVGPGLVEFTYSIPHGGEWEFIVIIKRGGQEIDRAVFTQEVR